MYTYVVKYDGTLIKYIHPKHQTVRLIELACLQNPESKYYVTYDCPDNTDVKSLSAHKIEMLSEIKKICTTQEHIEIFNKIKKSVEMMESFEIPEDGSGILLNIDNNFYIMTPENYINHQNIFRIEKNLKPNFSIQLDKSPTTIYDSPKHFTQTEYSTLISDSNSNEFIVFFEILNKK
jgi:hypothetical protein